MENRLERDSSIPLKTNNYGWIINDAENYELKLFSSIAKEVLFTL